MEECCSDIRTIGNAVLAQACAAVICGVRDPDCVTTEIK